MTIYQVIFMADTVGFFNSEQKAYKTLKELVYRHFKNNEECIKEFESTNAIYDLDCYVSEEYLDMGE